jgi:hypothetical protein
MPQSRSIAAGLRPANLMNAHLTEERFLQAWAHEEINDLAGLAHELQMSHGMKSSDLAARFRAWAQRKGLDPIAVSRWIDRPVEGPVAWPWASPCSGIEVTPKTLLEQYTADHQALREVLVREAQIVEPVLVDASEFQWSLLRIARKGKLLPMHGVLVRYWSSQDRGCDSGIHLGIRLYEIQGVRFAMVHFLFTTQYYPAGFQCLVVDQKDYRRLYRIAVGSLRRAEVTGHAPTLPAAQKAVLWNNTIGYLNRPNLRRIERYGGRARRGLLLSGAPGNGKTMACRWLWEECRRRGWQWRLVTPDAFRRARLNNTVPHLFRLHRRGILFFDDMDLALRDRETVRETEDQAIFLTALDGMTTRGAVVFVFTTNCPLELIDRAFKRPGRIDVALEFKPPDADLRRQLMQGWHEEIRAHLNLDEAVASTDGYSFAEIEELKNLLIMHFLENERWDWPWAVKQFHLNREDIARKPLRHVGFHAAAAKAARS